MSNKTLNLDERLYSYLRKKSVREAPILSELRTATAELHGAQMQIAPEQGQFMAWLVEAFQAKKLLELGTFTGYSALVMALALPEDGKLMTCDIDKNSTAIAQKFWAKAGLTSKIELKLGSGLLSMKQLLTDGHQESFDLIFIDADKANYPEYYELALQLLRKGGLVLVDNVLWGGAVADPNRNDKQTQAIRQLNDKILKDERVSISLLPLADGLTLACKR